MTRALLYNLKDAANMLNFLTSHKIMDMAGLDKVFGDMIGKQQDIREKLKPIDRRIKTIDEHIRHSGNYKGYRAQKAQYEKLYAQYKTLKKSTGIGAGRKAQKALVTANEYYETHRNEIIMYEKAEQYLKGVLQTHFDPKKLPPVKKWQAERDKLITERGKLNQRYAELKDEVKQAEQMRKSVYSIMRQEQREQQPRRAHDIDR